MHPPEKIFRQIFYGVSGNEPFTRTITVHVIRYNMDKTFREFIDFINLRDT